MTKFKQGDKVRDLDGRSWVIRDVISWKGNHWYNVRRSEFGRCYDAVRYDSDLVAATESPLANLKDVAW